MFLSKGKCLSGCDIVCNVWGNDLIRSCAPRTQTRQTCYKQVGWHELYCVRLHEHKAGTDSVPVCLQEQRSRIREFAQAKAERDGKQADEGQAVHSKADLDAMWAEVSTLRAERDTLKGIVDSLKKPLEEHTAAADELWKKKSDKRREYVRAPPAHPVVAAYLSPLSYAWP